jgi:phage terminase large subunit-like protein
MCSFNAATAAVSPDRVDALVWALTELTGNCGTPAFLLA